MERLWRDMEKSKGKTVVLNTGLKDKTPASEMMGNADVEEEEALEDFRISEADDDEDEGEDDEPVSIKLSPMEGPLLRNLEKDTFDFKFTVRIGRIWEHWSADSSTLYDLHFVMVDHNGRRTEGSIPKDKMAKFKNKFHEWVALTIQHYKIFRARDKYKAVDHPFRISFVWRMLAESVVPDLLLCNVWFILSLKL